MEGRPAIKIDSVGRIQGAEVLEDARESEKFNRTIRVCLSRSRTSAEFKKILKEESVGFKELTDLELTSFILAEKNEVSHNPGQVMPVGGRMNDNEGASDSAVRQLFSETHLKPAGPIKDLGRMRYKIPGRTQENLTHFVGTKILPTDRPFSINPEEDKIKRFHYFTLGQLNDLIINHSVRHGGKDVSLLDSLRTKLKIDEINPEGEGPVKVNLEVIDFAQKEEAAKKKAVLLQWFESGYDFFVKYGLERELDGWKKILEGERLPGANHVEGEIPHPRKELDLFAVQWVWREVIFRLEEVGVDVSLVKDNIFHAVDVNNFAESVKENDGGPSFASDLEAGLYFAGVLSETYHLDSEYLEIARSSRHLKELVGGIERFLKILAPNSGDISGSLDTLGQVLAEAALPDKKAIEQKVEQAFCSAFHLNRNDLPRKLNSIDEFLDGLAKHAINPAVQGEYSSNKIEQNNEIRRADLVTLLRKAFPTGDDGWKDRYRSENDPQKNSLKSVIFEARRKLILLALLSSAEEYYRGKEIMTDKIESIYSRFISGPNYNCNLRRMNDENGELVDIKVEMLDDDSNDSFEYDEYVPEPHSSLRKLVTGSGSYYCDIDKPLSKTWESFARKMLVRGYDNPELITDVFRRSITLADVDVTNLSPEIANKTKERLYKREKRSIPNIFVKDKNGAQVEVGEINEVAAVLDILEQFARQPGVRIIDYKPTPDLGEKIKSDSPGGGSVLRFAKFYIEHTTPSGEIYHEEVQVYTPGENGEPSAFYYKNKKEEDDKKYFLKRLLRTKGRHSVIDVLFPVWIYGLLIFEAKRRLEKSVLPQQLPLGL